MIQTRAGNVNMRVGDKLAEGLLYVLSAKGAQFNASLGQRPQEPDCPQITNPESFRGSQFSRGVLDPRQK
jgi:hypothetical protein